MKVVRGVAGVVAILFSIQPLASWAAGSMGRINTVKKEATGKKDVRSVKLVPISKALKDDPGRGNPICGNGGG